MNNFSLGLVFLFALSASQSWASDTCRGRAIQATANVSVSDGSSFNVESFFAGVDETAVRFIDDNDLVVAVERGGAWVSQNGQAQLAGEPQKAFALGHQFHALLLYFEEVAENVQAVSDVSFGETRRPATIGDYPYGGTVYLVGGNDQERPEGLVFELPESPRIEVTLNDWRLHDDTPVPFDLSIDDGRQVFRYRFTKIEIAPRTDTWFQDRVMAPGIAEVVSQRAAVRDRPDACK